MGLLSEGSPLEWEEVKQYSHHVKENGIVQFINMYSKLKDVCKPCLKWGDEIEYMILSFDHANRKTRVSLRSNQILKELHANEKNSSIPEENFVWVSEFGAYMIEGTPAEPYGSNISDFTKVETSMKNRRNYASRFLHQNESLATLTVFPLFGCSDFTDPASNLFNNEFMKSDYVSDDVVFFDHPRYLYLAKNIRKRRGKKVDIRLPIFVDRNTSATSSAIAMDCMAFGMGCCCLQVTFQACSINEARLLYDQLANICPIMMALSASSPIFKGVLSDRDCRWSVISASVDDRTVGELDHIMKSRYDSISSYLSPENSVYNDIPLEYDVGFYEKLVNAEIDPLLSQHIAHLFIRDPLVVYNEKLDQDNTQDNDHFENIQSTNWQTLRFKPASFDGKIGWRVEFRPMEVQLTDFENAAYVVFVVLLTRTILSFKLNFLVPISKVDQNMQRAQNCNAVLLERFYFRTDIYTRNHGTCENPLLTEMSIDDIINGCKSFVGLVPLIQNFLNHMELEPKTACTIHNYLKLIQDRASGKVQTSASLIRRFIFTHPKYENDSIITPEMNYDLCKFLLT